MKTKIFWSVLHFCSALLASYNIEHNEVFPVWTHYTCLTIAVLCCSIFTYEAITYTKKQAL